MQVMWFGRLIGLFIGFIIFIVILVTFFGHHGSKPPATTTTVAALPSYAGSNAAVSFTQDGIVNADSLHRSIRITVNNSQVTLDVLKGYNPQVIQSQSFENNQEAYTVFLKAINNASFLAKTKNTKIPGDETGQCALGFRFILDLSQDGSDLSRSWASSCGTKVGTSTGAVSTIQALFEDQVPDYQTLVSTVNLSATTAQD
jgi:hypothetical protein